MAAKSGMVFIVDVSECGSFYRNSFRQRTNADLNIALRRTTRQPVVYSFPIKLRKSSVPRPLHDAAPRNSPIGRHPAYPSGCATKSVRHVLAPNDVRRFRSTVIGEACDRLHKRSQRWQL